MRMYNPEWEAIKSFDYVPRIVDVQFDLPAGEIPADHGYVLHAALVGLLPWLREVPELAIHPVHGAPSGRNDNLVVNRRVKLVLRLPVERLADARALVGMRLDLGTGELLIGEMKEKRLAPFATLYSHFVALGVDDELAFLVEAEAQLEKISVHGGLIPGKKRTMHLPEGEVAGYSLMLHDVDPQESLHLQETGLGLYRGQGCGIFIPHKSIKAVATG